MSLYYFDIETTGLDPKTDKIITIQYQELERETGKPIGKLVILKEWESSEKEIINKFIIDTNILDLYQFTFVPVGYNLIFEHNFLKERTAFHNINSIDILNNPFIDIISLGIIMNKGEFKGSGLNKITEKEGNGKQIPPLYHDKEYDKIIKYIENETESFLKLLCWLYKKMPVVLQEFKINNNIK